MQLYDPYSRTTHDLQRKRILEQNVRYYTFLSPSHQKIELINPKLKSQEIQRHYCKTTFLLTMEW